MLYTGLGSLPMTFKCLISHVRTCHINKRSMLLTDITVFIAMFLAKLEKETDLFIEPRNVKEHGNFTEDLKNNFDDTDYVEWVDGLNVHCDTHNGLNVHCDAHNRDKREAEQALEPVCATRVSKGAPRYGESYVGENRTILNGNSENELLNNHVQTVDFVFCMGENVDIGPELTLSCQQKYVYVNFLVLGESFRMNFLRNH